MNKEEILKAIKKKLYVPEFQVDHYKLRDDLESKAIEWESLSLEDRANYIVGWIASIRQKSQKSSEELYIYNEDSHEIHDISKRPYGQHHLEKAKPENLVVLHSKNNPPVKDLEDGKTEITIVDLSKETRETIALNKCEYCFPYPLSEKKEKMASDEGIKAGAKSIQKNPNQL